MAENMAPNEMEEAFVEPELFTLVDEDGNEKIFELVDTLEENKTLYFALIPHIEEPEELLNGEVELVVLVASKDEDGNDILEPIESDEEYERIAQIFIDRLDEDLDEEDDEEE